MSVADPSSLLGRRSWLVRGKLKAPRQQVRLIDRPKLIATLDKVRDHRLGLVVGPAGFGKTTLLSQWRDGLLDDGVKVAWLTLDEADGEAEQFLSYLVFAVASADLSVGQLELLAEQGLMDTAPRAALAAILEMVARAEVPLVIILDDYHRVQCADIDALIGEAVALAPPNLCLVLTGRERPSIGLPRLLASGQAVELQAEDLRFTRSEVRDTVDASISEATLEALFERTEGWPVAVQLAALLVNGKVTDDSVLVEQVTGHSGHIASYLADQVLASLPDTVQDFLLRTSVLERFSAPLADVVCGRSDSWRVLQQLEKLHALLVPLDDRQTWFRYHHLFADYLQNLLRQKSPDLMVTLHRAASEWFEAEGQVSEAVRHARLAGDLDRCASMIEGAGGWELILYGGIGYLRTLLRNMPDDELDRFPRLQLARAYLHMKEGHLREAQALWDAAVASPGGARPGSALERDLVNMRMMLECYQDRVVTTAGLADLRARAKAWPAEDALTHGMFDCQLAMTNLALGRFAAAEQVSKTAMRAMRQARSALGLNYCYLHAGVAAFYRGHLRMAEAHFWEARRMAEDNFGADSGLKFISDVLLGGLLWWRGELKDDSRRSFFRALDHVEQYDGWFEIYAFGLGTAVDLALAEDNVAWADGLIAQAERIASIRGLQRLDDMALAFRLRLEVAKGDEAGVDATVRRLDGRYEPGCWRDDPYCWRPYVEMAASAHRHDEVWPDAPRMVDDAIECARSLDARFHLTRLLIRRACLADQAGLRDRALADIEEALRFAAPELIRQPFQADPAVAPLLRAAHKLVGQDAGGGLLARFLSDALAAVRQPLLDDARRYGDLSPREQDVLMELRRGLSNKQIARSLDITENTVKYHLKNIFAKLGVERRTQAIALLQDDRFLPTPTPRGGPSSLPSG